MPGVLEGNLAEAGSFQECLSIYKDTKYGPIKGRHCSFRIIPGDDLLKIILKMSRNVTDKQFEHLRVTIMDDVKMVWSVCVPHSCDYDDVFRHFNKTMHDLTEGLNLTMTLKKEYCISKDDLPKLSNGTLSFIVVCSLLVGTVIICTLVDMFTAEKNGLFVDIFSAIQNGKILFKVNQNKDDLGCMHGIRFISIGYVMTGHRYIHLMTKPTVNSMELVEWLNSYISTLVSGGTVSVDSFFLVGAILLSYHFFNTVTKTNKFNLFYFYLYRHLRIDIPLIFAVGVQAFMLQHFGSGPFYDDFIYIYQKPCQTFWYTAILHAQAFVNKKFLCVIQTWYLSVDMIYYYLSPIVLVPLWKKPAYGYAILLSTFLLSVLIAFYTAWVWGFTGEMPMTKHVEQTDYFSEFYIQPHCRAPPYVLGLAVGYMFYKTKNNKIRINKTANIVGWCLTFVCMFAVLTSAHMYHVDDYKYNKLFSSLYAALHRTVWCLGLVWIIFSCVNGYGGFINVVLSHPIFQVLGRLGYTMFLMHYMFQGAMQSSLKQPAYFSDFLAIYMAVADIVLMSILCAGVALCFEYPFVRMVGLLTRRGGGTSTKVDPDNKSGKLDRSR